MSMEVSNSQILQVITELSGQVQNLTGQYQNLSDQVRLERLFFYSKRASFLCGKINLGSGGASHLSLSCFFLFLFSFSFFKAFIHIPANRHEGTNYNPIIY